MWGWPNGGYLDSSSLCSFLKLDLMEGVSSFKGSMYHYYSPHL